MYSLELIPSIYICGLDYFLLRIPYYTHTSTFTSPSSGFYFIPFPPTFSTRLLATSVVREEAPLYHALSSQDVDTLDCIHTLCYTLSGGREPLQTPAQEGGDPAAVANAVTHLARQAESIRKTIEGPRNESMAEKLASVSINMTSQLDLPVSLRVSTQRKLLMELPGLESTKARALANTGRFGTAYDGIQLAKEVAFGYENERQTAVEHTERKHDRGEDAWDGTGHRNEANQGNEGKCGDTEVDQDYTNKTARGETLSHEGHDDHIRECSAKVLQSLPSLLELPREDANSCANHSTRCESATSSTLPASPGSSLAPPCSSDPQLQLGQSSAALSAVPYTSDVNSTRSMTRSRTSIADDKVVPDSVMDWSSSDDDDSVLSAGGRLPLLLSRLAQSNGSALDQHRLSQLYEDQWLPPHRHPSVASEVMRTRIRRSGSVKQKGGEKPPLWTARTQAMHEVDAKQKALKQVYDEKIKTITREYKRETGRLLIINPTNEEETKKRDESLSIARTAYLRKRAELTVATAQDFVTSALEQGKLYGVDLRRKIAKLWLVKKGNECACALNLPNVLVIPKEAEVMKRKVRGSRPLSKDKKDVMQDAGAPVREDRTDYSDDNAIADNRIDEDDVSSGDSENEDNAWAWDREAVDRGWVEAFYKEISPQPSKCDGVQVPLEVLSEAVREDTSHRSIRRQLNPDLDACAMAVGPLGETLQQRISLEIVREHVWSEAAAIAISKSHTHGKKMKMSHQDYIGAYSSSHLAFLPTGPGMRSLSSALIVTPPSQHTLHALSLRHQDSSSTSSEHMSPRFSPIARILTTARTAPFPKSIVQIATCTSGLHASNLTEKLLTAVNRIQSREKEGIMRQRNAIRSIHQRTSSIQSTTRSSNGIDGAMASGSIATGVPPLKRKRSETDPLDVGAKRGHLRQKRAALSSLEPRGNKRKSDTMGGWSNHIQTTGLEDIDDISRFESLEGEGELSAVDVEDIASDVEIGSANTVGRSINGSGDGHGDDGDDDDSGDARQNRQRITSQGSTSEMSGENSEWATNVGGRREIGDSYAMKLAYELGTLGSVTLGDQGQHLVMARTTRHVALFKSQLVDGWSSDSDDGDDEPRRDHGGVDHYAFASPKREIGGYLLGELPGGKERVRHLKSAYVKGRRARKGKGHKSQLNNEHDQERQRKRRSKVGLSLLSSSDSDSTQSSDREIGSEEEEDSTEKAIRRLEDKDPDWFRPKLKRIAAVETPVPMIHAEPHPLFAEEVLLLCVDGRMLVWDVEASVSSLSSSSSLLVNDNPVTGVSMGKWSRSNDHREAWEDHQTSIPPYPQRKRSRPTSTETTKKHGTQRNQGARPRDTTKNSDERVDGDGGSSGNESDDNDYGSRKRRRRKVVPDRDFIASHPNVHVSVEVADAWEVLEDEERQKEGRASLTQQLARGGAVEMQTGYAPFSKRNPLLGESNRPWWQIGNESEKDAQEWRLSKYLSTDQGTLVKLAYEEDDDASLALVQDSLGMELHKCGSQSQRQAFLNALSGGSYSSQFTPQFWSHGTHADGVLTLSNWWRAPTFSGNVHDMNELYSTRQSPSSQGGDGKTTRTPWKDIPNDGYGGALTGVLAGGIYPGQPTNITDPKYWARRERTMQMTKAMVIHALDERHPSFVDPSLAYQSAQTPFPPWGTVKYSMHPRVALVATPSRIYAVDLRAANAIPVQSTLAGVAPFIPTPSAPGTFSQCHTRSSGSYHSTSSSSTALLSRGVSVLPLPLMLDGIDQRIYGIQTDPSCPSHLAVSTSSQLLLLDQRSPCAPLLRWDMPSARATTHDLVKRRTNISYIREGDTSTSSSVLAAQIGHWYSRSTAPIRAPLIIHAYKEGHFCPTIGVNTLRTVPLRDISFLHCPSIDPLVAPIAVELLTASTRTHPTQQNLQPKGGKRGPSQPHRIYITTPSTDTPRHNPISGGETTTSSPQQLVMPHTYIPLLHPTSALSSRSFIVASSSRYGVTLLFEYVQLSPADAAQVALSDASVDRLKKGGRSFGSKEGLSALFASPRENEDYLLGQTPLGTAYTACGPPHVLGVFDKSFDETMLPVGIKGTTGNMTTNNAADQLHPVLIEGDGTARHLAATHAKDPERVLPDPSKPLELDNVWENQHLLDETRETYTFPVRELFPATFIATTLVHHHPKFVVALPGSYVNPPRTVDSDPLTLSSKVLSRRPTLGELIELLPSDAASARRFTIERLTYCGELSLHPFAMCMLDPTQTMSPPLTTTTSTTGAPSSNGLPSSPTNTVELNPPTSTSSSPPSSTTTLSASFPSPTTPGLLDLPFWSGKMPTDKDIALPIGARISAGLAPVPYVPPFVSPGLTQAMSSILVTNRLQDPLNLVPPLISTATSVKVAQSHSLLLLPSSRCAVENVNTLVDVIARFEHDLAK